MAKTLGTIKKYMNKVLAACCAVLLTFMTFLVLWQVFIQIRPQQPGGIYRGTGKVLADLDRIYRRSLCIFHQRAYGTDPGKR